MKYLMALILLVLATACEKESNTESKELKYLSENRAKWQKLSVASYDMEQSLNCFCIVAGTHDVLVEDGSVKTATQKGTGVQVANPAQHFKTVDQLFDFIESSLKRNPYDYYIEYHSEMGYPVNIYFDYDKQMVDEEMGYTTTELKKR